MRYAWDKTMRRLLSSPVSLWCFFFLVLLTHRWDSLSYPLMHLKLTCLLAAQHPPLEVSKPLSSHLCVYVCMYSSVWSYICVWVYRCAGVLCECASVLSLCHARGFDGWCVTSVWSQPFGGNPLGLEDALVLLYFTAYLFTPPLCALWPPTIAIGLWWSIGSLTLKLDKTLSALCPDALWHADTLGFIHHLGWDIHSYC